MNRTARDVSKCTYTIAKARMLVGDPRYPFWYWQIHDTEGNELSSADYYYDTRHDAYAEMRGVAKTLGLHPTLFKGGKSV